MEETLFFKKNSTGWRRQSYGIQVARLAGLPEEVLNRATQLTQMLSDNDLIEKTKLITEIKDISQNLQQMHQLKRIQMPDSSCRSFSAEVPLRTGKRNH